jgi:hypothetical protein
MSIRVVCPNGHVLKVKDSFAGKIGLCPTCKARVEVPRPPQGELSEDAILGILGPYVPRPASPDSARKDLRPADTPRVSETDSNSPPKKSCHKCNREIAAGIHICPFCHTYIAELGDF